FRITITVLVTRSAFQLFALVIDAAVIHGKRRLLGAGRILIAHMIAFAAIVVVRCEIDAGSVAVRRRRQASRIEAAAREDAALVFGRARCAAITAILDCIDARLAAVLDESVAISIVAIRAEHRALALDAFPFRLELVINPVAGGALVAAAAAVV